MEPLETKGTIKSLKRCKKQNKFRKITKHIDAVIFYKKKRHFREIGNRLKRSKSWAHNCVKRYKISGIEGLFDRPRSGRPPILSRKDEASFITRIQQRPIKEDEYTAFKGRYIGKILLEEYKVKYSPNSIYALLSRLGFTKIKPRPVHENNDKEVMDKWKKESLPKFVREVRAKYPDKKVSIWFQDESRFGEKKPFTGVWQLKGTKLELIKQIGFSVTYIFGAINPLTGERSAFVCSDCNTDVMNIHLQQISASIPSDSHTILVVDQASWHSKSTTLKIPKNISLLDLPPYSPQINPIEKLWQWLKDNYFYNLIIDNKENIDGIVCDIWNKLTNEVVKSVCYRKWLDVSKIL